MSSNPRRTPVTRPEPGVLTIKTNIGLRKGASFHSPSSSSSSPDESAWRPPSLPRRSHTNLDDVIDAHCRRINLTLGDIDKTLTASKDDFASPSSRRAFRDTSLPIPLGVLDHTLDSMVKEAEAERRVLRPRTRRSPRHHDSDSGLGSSVGSSSEKDASIKKDRSFKASAITRSVAARANAAEQKGLSPRANNRICEHTLKPLLAKPSLKEFHSLVLECPKKIQEKEIVCLRDLEKTLLLIAPERTKSSELYLDFCLTTVTCIQATVEYLNEREQTRPRDVPYSNGYFIDLVEQIQQYAQQLADAREKGNKPDEMDVDPTDEIKLHGGIHINGRPAELVRVKRNGKAISMATGEPVEIEDQGDGAVRFKRSASQELEDEEEIMRSMARRKKNASPEELAPKKCREPGCTKEFKRPCDLTKHEKTHSRPWKCPVPTCKYHDYGWPTEKEMDRHHNDKHSSAPPMYECLFKPCPYKSKRESNCKQHMEKAHNWTYVRTKTNGRKSGTLPSISGNSTHPTPQPHNLPTPTSEHSIATPPDDWRMYGSNNLDFPSYNMNDTDISMIPQELSLDYSPTDNYSPIDNYSPADHYSPVDNGTPLTESSVEHNSAYQDIGNDFTLYDDIYAANVRLAPPSHADIYIKEMTAQHFAPYTSAEYAHVQPAHLSPTGQGNAMLFTPASLAEVDEGFDEHPDFGRIPNAHGHGDFTLFPAGVSKAMLHEPLFASEIPSMAAEFAQPSHHDLLNAFGVDWPHDIAVYLPH